MPNLSPNCKWINDTWNVSQKANCWAINGLDAVKTYGSAGSIQGSQVLTNQGENNSLYYAEYNIGKDYDSRSGLNTFFGLAKKLADNGWNI